MTPQDSWSCAQMVKTSTNLRVVSATLAICALWLSGCAGARPTWGQFQHVEGVTQGTKIIDGLSSNEAKGYVEFYATAGDTLGMPVPIAVIRGTNAYVCDCIRNSGRLKVACRPGEITFLVFVNLEWPPEMRLESIWVKTSLAMGMAKPVTVNVSENGTIPIPISFRRLSVEKDRSIRYSWRCGDPAPHLTMEETLRGKIEAAIKEQRLREWSFTSMRATRTARLTGCKDDALILTDEKGEIFQVNPGELSEYDQQWLFGRVVVTQ